MLDCPASPGSSLVNQGSTILSCLCVVVGRCYDSGPPPQEMALRLLLMDLVGTAHERGPLNEPFPKMPREGRDWDLSAWFQPPASLSGGYQKSGQQEHHLPGAQLGQYLLILVWREHHAQGLPSVDVSGRGRALAFHPQHLVLTLPAFGTLGKSPVKEEA